MCAGAGAPLQRPLLYPTGHGIQQDGPEEAGRKEHHGGFRVWALGLVVLSLG